MFFDVLKLQEPSWNDTGRIWDRSFFQHFHQNFWSIMMTKVRTLNWLETIDLRFEMWNPHQNNITEGEKIVRSQTNVAISQTQHFVG